MHTRYAPVRHSQAPEGALPSDLHVLGLPLAFILSQDQTLHCSIAVLVIFPVLGLRYDSLLFLIRPLPTGLPASRKGLLLLMLASSFQRTRFRRPSAIPRFFMAENGCKSTAFFHTRKRFLSFFSKNFLYADCQSVGNDKFGDKGNFCCRIPRIRRIIRGKTVRSVGEFSELIDFLFTFIPERHL